MRSSISTESSQAPLINPLEDGSKRHPTPQLHSPSPSSSYDNSLSSDPSLHHSALVFLDEKSQRTSGFFSTMGRTFSHPFDFISFSRTSGPDEAIERIYRLASYNVEGMWDTKCSKQVRVECTRLLKYVESNSSIIKDDALGHIALLIHVHPSLRQPFLSVDANRSLLRVIQSAESVKGKGPPGLSSADKYRSMATDALYKLRNESHQEPVNASAETRNSGMTYILSLYKPVKDINEKLLVLTAFLKREEYAACAVKHLSIIISELGASLWTFPYTLSGTDDYIDQRIFIRILRFLNELVGLTSSTRSSQSQRKSTTLESTMKALTSTDLLRLQELWQALLSFFAQARKGEFKLYEEQLSGLAIAFESLRR